MQRFRSSLQNSERTRNARSWIDLIMKDRIKGQKDGVMNHESQIEEWKESWKDEYIKWICGFANASGGVLIIGKNDEGQISGVHNPEKLLEDIPNKIRDILGIIVEVNLEIIKDKPLIIIKVPSYPYPVNYKGEYHYRSGSTKQILKGQALNAFLLKSYGKHWDGVEVPGITVSEFDERSFHSFLKKAVKSQRIDSDHLPVDYTDLLDKLHLMENGFIKRAAVLLFAVEPQNYITGAFIKIAYFDTPAEIIFQDVIEGNLLNQADRVFDLLFSKYLKARISYEGNQRVEEFDYDRYALREVIHNAIVHKDYSSGIPIQIGVLKDRLFVYNAGHLPQNWTIETITSQHRSIPYNPDIANAFFKAGLVESWGRGIEKIISSTKSFNNTLPVFTWDNGLNVEFKSQYPDTVSIIESSEKSSEKIVELIRKNREISALTIAENIGITQRAVEKQISKLKDEGKLRRVGPAKGGYWEIVES